MTRLVLASESPSRLGVLQSAGVHPIVRVSGVDEPTIMKSLGADPTPARVVITLAREKAARVAANPPEGLDEFLVVGCDSMLLIDGRLEGKPLTVETALRRWQRMRGRHGVLLTGHAVMKVVDGEVVGSVADVAETTVHFGAPSDVDLRAYLDTGEPLQVAGAFTLESLGGWFIDRISGDPSSVVGIGLPLLSRLLKKLDVPIVDLWASNPPPED